MHAALQIAFNGMKGSETLEALIEEKATWLERFEDRITSCRVVVELAHRQHRHGDHYQVSIDVRVPGSEIAVTRESGQSGSADLAGAIRDAFDVVRRQLEDHSRKQRHEVKSHEPAPHARVGKLFAEEGYGFLETSDGREVYFHRHALLNGDFENLQVGTEVAFVEAAGEKGPQASSVRLVGRHGHQ